MIPTAGEMREDARPRAIVSLSPPLFVTVSFQIYWPVPRHWLRRSPIEDKRQLLECPCCCCISLAEQASMEVARRGSRNRCKVQGSHLRRRFSTSRVLFCDWALNNGVLSGWVVPPVAVIVAECTESEVETSSFYF